MRGRLASLTDGELAAVVAGVAARPWGFSGQAWLDGSPLFAKRVPLTDVEASAAPSTRNHYGLPTYFSYGVGSSGFNVWREVTAHETVSGNPAFPELLHRRVVDREPAPDALPMSTEEYVRYWNGTEAVGRYREQRQAATREVVLVQEHVPHPGISWLLAHQDRAGDLVEQLFDAVDLLRSSGIVHFDAHLGNVVTDGRRHRLTDFGLAMSTDFDLSEEERSFLGRHRHYDLATVLGSLGMVTAALFGRPPTAAGLAACLDGEGAAREPAHPVLLETVRRYRAPALYMVDFFDRMRAPAKAAVYDDALVAGMLAACA